MDGPRSPGLTPWRRLWGWLLLLPQRLLLGGVRFYQRHISPLTPPACRFAPTCSEYARQALLRHGAAKGSLLAGWRLLRCQPFCPGGHDPVPDDWRAALRRRRPPSPGCEGHDHPS